jgi:hypothetical protein
MSARKEPNYFAFQGKAPAYRGPDDDQPGRYAGMEDRLRVAKYANSITGAEDYARLFKRVEEETAVGESSVSYLYVSETAERIRAAIPEAKLIAILRHPVDRAYSKFQQFIAEGLEPIADFEEALAAEEERIRRGWSPTWHYARRGLYHEQLRRYYDAFDRDRILVSIYDDFAADAAGELRRIFRFLGVAEDFVPDTARRHNAARRRKRSFTWWGRARKVRFNPPPLDPERRLRLTAAFRDDILALQDLIGRDLSPWLAARSKSGSSVAADLLGA